MISTSENLTNLVREVLTHHMLEVSADPMFVLDGVNVVIVANRAASRQLGWTHEQMLGRRWDDLVASYDSAASHILSSNVATSVPGIATARDAHLHRADGSVHPVRLVTYRLWLGSGTAPMVVVADRRLGAAGRSDR